jgi:hypothetical protein
VQSRDSCCVDALQIKTEEFSMKEFLKPIQRSPENRAVRKLIRKMLSIQPEDRPSIDRVLESSLFSTHLSSSLCLRIVT